MGRKTMLRIGKAVLLGWGIVKPKPPTTPCSRGSVWIQEPEGWNTWRSMDGTGKNWLNKALDSAGVPK
jgi:hypothetical protein